MVHVLVVWFSDRDFHPSPLCIFPLAPHNLHPVFLHPPSTSLPDWLWQQGFLLLLLDPFLLSNSPFCPPSSLWPWYWQVAPNFLCFCYFSVLLCIVTLPLLPWDFDSAVPGLLPLIQAAGFSWLPPYTLTLAFYILLLPSFHAFSHSFGHTMVMQRQVLVVR